MKKYFFIAIICFGIFGVAGKSWATTLYVDQTLGLNCVDGDYSISGRDCSGANGNAYRNIKTALLNFNAGDSVILRGGLYQEGHIRLDYIKVGTSDNWNTIKSFDGEWAILDGQNGLGDGGINGKKVGDDQNSRCTIGFSVSDTSGEYDLKYWKFEKLEIKNGASVDGLYAAGFSGNGGPFWFKNVYVHDNNSSSASNNPGGVVGEMWQDSIIEYSYFAYNGCNLANHNCADINIMSDYIPNTTAQNGYLDNGHAEARNIYRYNRFQGSPVAIKYKQDQFFSGRNGYDDTYKTYGDNIHHNIITDATNIGIDARQDFIQIHNNIIDSCSNGIKIGEDDTRSIYKSVVYNNTIMSSVDESLAFTHSKWYTYQPAQYYAWSYNNIIDSGRDGNSQNVYSEHGVMTHISPNWDIVPDWNNFFIDRNYFYRPTFNANDPDGTNVILLQTGINPDSYTKYGISDFETLRSGVDIFRNDYNLSDLLYSGTLGADKYLTRPVHIVEGAKAISGAGIGGLHPYLDGVTLPSYIGATNPSDNDWVLGVLDLATVSSLQNSESGDPSWIEGGDAQIDTTSPAAPSGLLVN